MSPIPEEKWGTTRSLVRVVCGLTAHSYHSKLVEQKKHRTNLFRHSLTLLKHSKGQTADILLIILFQIPLQASLLMFESPQLNKYSVETFQRKLYAGRYIYIVSAVGLSRSVEIQVHLVEEKE